VVLAAFILPMSSAYADEKPINVLVLIYDPVMKTKGNLRLSQYMKWPDPEQLNRRVVASLKQASGGFANYNVVDSILVNAFPRKRDGFNYDEASFLAMWADKNKAHQPDTVSYAEIFRKHNLVERIRRENIREIWLWGSPYFGWDEYAVKLPGDRIPYRTDNPWYYRPYDIPECGRTVWVMGWSYERGEAEALHSYGHRIEGILSLTVGQGIWDRQKNAGNPWTKFTLIDKHLSGGGQVGNVHYPPNGKSDYDYAQKAFADSTADDWLQYPKLTGARKRINCETWGGPDYHLNYMKWWLSHLPKAPGTTDGFANNWWQYIVNYDEAVAKYPPPGGKPQIANKMMK
jgi:hypothetical protein